MAPIVVAAIIGAAATAVNSIVNAGVNGANNDRSFGLANRSQEWQKYYDLNQTQIRVDDMAKAGLNPLLASPGGASSVGSQSATPVQSNLGLGDSVGELVKALGQDSELKQQRQISSDNNKTAKDIAETNAEASKEVAEIQAETAKANAQLNAETQSAIATANNEAQSELRSAEAYLKSVQGDKLNYQHLYNILLGLYDGPSSGFSGFLHDNANRITTVFANGDKQPFLTGFQKYVNSRLHRKVFDVE